MRIPVRSLAGALIVLGSFASCSVDRAGLDGTAGAGTGGGAAGRGGTPGVAGSGGRGGAAGTGTPGLGGGGAAGTGVAGMGGGGAAGTSAVAGSGGTSGPAGQGGGGAAGTGAAGTGAAGTGAAGMGGAAGTSAPACGPANCANGCCREGQCVTNRSDQVCGTAGVACQACAGCFRCGNQGSCEPTPSANWTVICQSAVIAATKPNGTNWDAPPPATSGIAPDTVCELTIDNDDTGETSVINDSLTPMWNQPVNPNGGTNVTASLLMSTQNRWEIAVFDRDVQPIGATEPVCSTMPRLTADDLQRGMVTLMTGSCTQINLGLLCDPN